MANHDFTNGNGAGSDDDDDQNNGSGSGGIFNPLFNALTGGGGGGTAPNNDDEVLEMLIDYNEKFKGADPAKFRDQVINQALSVLISKNKPNPLLLGPAGVGKTRIVEDIARMIENKSPLIPSLLYGYTVYELPLTNLVAGAMFQGMLEQRMKDLVEYASNPENKVILFIDEIHLIVPKDSGGSDTYSKIAQILKPALARGDMKVIGATTSQEGRNFDDDPALSRRFTKIIVDELTREQTCEILTDATPSYESHYDGKVIAPADLHRITTLVADQIFGHSAHRPDNALTLMDRTMADAVIARQQAIRNAEDAGDHDLALLLTQAGPSRLNEERLRRVALRLASGNAEPPSADFAHVRQELQALRGQEEITEKVIEIIERQTLGVFDDHRPTALMFAGPSGVGNTEASKILAQTLTGQDPIIVNMTEYDHEHSLSKIVGSPPGYVGSNSNQEKPFDTMESNPYRLILLDEIEKAHVNVQRLFLSVLDEGTLRTAQGRNIDFSKAIIIATTNAARDALSGQRIGFGTQAPETSSQLIKELQQSFEPEFLGRFTDVLGFRPIRIETYREIMAQAYTTQRAQIVADRQSLDPVLPASMDPAQVEKLSNENFDSRTGARSAPKLARRYIEDLVIDHNRAKAQAQAALAVATPVTGQDDDDQDDTVTPQEPAEDQS